MALVRVAQYSSTPGPVTDYQAQNAHLQAFTNQLMTQQFILDSGTDQPVIKQGCYVSHGGSLYIADADTSITGSPSDGSVYIRVSGTTTLTVEFVTDISGYTWNPVYTALTNGSYTLLPYLIVKAGTSWTRYNFNPNNQQFGNLGAVTCTSVDTGQGAVKLYPLIFESVSVTATSGDATVTISPISIGQEVLVTATLTSANNYDAQVALPPGSEKYSIIPSLTSIGVAIGGANISLYSTSFGTPETVTRNILVKRLS
jgi:hypothetical protein